MSHLILDVYLDESGTHEGAQGLSIAGYMAPADRWAEFSREWQRAFGDWGLQWFHMTDFVNGARPYDQWNENERELMFQRLVRIVNNHACASVGCSVAVAEVDAIFPKGLKREIGGGAYGIAFTGLCMEVAKFLGSHSQQRAAYIAGAGVKGRGKILANFTLGERRPDWRNEFRVHSLRFEDARRLLPLQAADMLAYEMHHCLPRETGIDPRPVRRGHLKALAGIQRTWIRLEGQTLQNFAKVLSIKMEYEGQHGGRRKTHP